MNPLSPYISAQSAEQIAQVIGSVYRIDLNQSLIDFKAKSIVLLTQILDFESACWFTITGGSLNLQIDNAYLYRLPKGFAKGFCPVAQNKLLTEHSKMMNLCCSQTIDEVDQYASYQYQFGVAHQVLFFSRHKNTYHLICLNRHDKQARFNENEVSISQFMLDRFKQAFHLHIRSKLKRNWQYRRSFQAICNKQGHLIEAQPDFIHCLRQNIPDWDQKTLPYVSEDNPTPTTLDCGNIKIRLNPDGEVLIAEVYQHDPCIESLTPAEQAIASLLIDAMSPKQIAAKLGKQPKTIEHQLKKLYTKLEVFNKTEAIWYLNKSNYRFEH